MTWGHGSWHHPVALASLRRLWAVQIMARSPLAFSRPCRPNLRKPLAPLICPSTGSTICFLRRYRLCRPARLSLVAMAATREPLAERRLPTG